MDQFPANETKPAEGYRKHGRNAAVESLRIEDLLPESQPTSASQTKDDKLPHQHQAAHTSRQLVIAQRRLEQLSVAAQAFSIQLDLQRLLDDVAEHAFRIVAVDRVIIHPNLEGKLVSEVSFPSTKQALEKNDDVLWCIRYLKPKISNLLEMKYETLRNRLCVPLVGAQNRVLGVIEFQNKRTGGEFTEDDQRAALCLARIATSAVDRALLFFRIEEWRQSIEILLSFNATVNQRLAPEQMVRELVANVTGFLGAQGGMAGIVMRTEEDVYLQCDGFYFGDLWTDFSRCWAPGEGIPGTVYETQFPYLSRDYKTDNLRERDLADAFLVGSCICVPIKNRKEDVLGFFQLHRRKGEPEFTWQEAGFLESLGNTAAVAIENARLVKSLEFKNEQVRNLSEDHVNRLEAERRHIARELHDETGQVLIGLKLRLQILGGLLTDDQADAKAELAELRSQVNHAAVQLKDLAKQLRPPTLDELGFEATLHDLVSDFRRRRSIEVHLDLDVIPRLSGEEQTALYRIVQECLTNIAKHSQATYVDITFYESENQQVLRVTDDGIGFQASQTTQGLGHVGIQERVTMLGGQLKVSSSVGGGTTIEVILPTRETA